MKHQQPSLGVVLRRSWKKHCPRCGKGALFRSWFKLRECCSVCGLAIQPRPGDTWGFWIIGDRIFVAVPMIALYLGFTPVEWFPRLFFLGVVVALFFFTMPMRLGICVGLDYLARRRWKV